MAKKKKKLSLGEQIARIRRAGVDGDEYLMPSKASEIGSLSERVEGVLELFQKARQKKLTEMLCFISYDIEDNRVRRVVADYLIERGCRRIQKSVYFAQLDRTLYRDMVQTLMEIQAMYDNDDSIFFLPVAEDNLQRMELIGRNLHYELSIDPGTTFFI